MAEAAELIRTRAVSATEMMDEVLARIGARNDDLNAFVPLAPEAARAEAEAVDRATARGESLGPLAGVPFGVKDMDRCAGMPTTNGSLLYKDAPPAEHDSVHTGRLRGAGAIPVGVNLKSSRLQ